MGGGGRGVESKNPQKWLCNMWRFPYNIKFSNFWTNGPIFKCHTFLETSECQLYEERGGGGPWGPREPPTCRAWGKQVFEVGLRGGEGNFYTTLRGVKIFFTPLVKLLPHTCHVTIASSLTFLTCNFQLSSWYPIWLTKMFIGDIPKLIWNELDILLLYNGEIRESVSQSVSAIFWAELKLTGY